MGVVKAAVKALIVKDGKFLAIWHSIDGEELWDLPGGRIEFGESPYAALHREVKEEVNLKVDVVKPVGLWWFFPKRLPDMQCVCYTFLCNLLSGDVNLEKNPDPSEFMQGYSWVSPTEFLSNKYKASNESLKKLITEVFNNAKDF